MVFSTPNEFLIVDYTWLIHEREDLNLSEKKVGF